MNHQENITNTILTHHLTAFGNNSIKEIISDYCEESTLLTVSREIKGLRAIEDFFIELFSLIPKGSSFTMKKSTIKDNIAYIVWESKNQINETYSGSDTFIIEDNKIKYHTLIMHKK
ncbi:hypothetical protein [uncultured Flavobacterium sp.]|uniref:hypothetical protein n=1 Tax=uncultured Flavobacterium sp. TaxID=165435 RepID=UPI0025FB804E|nr:hypothetical protein [uncultured Flavobacterium sp.]